MVSDLNLLGSGEALDDGLNTIISEFRLLTQEEQVIRPTASPLKLEPGKGRNVNVVNYGRVRAFDLQDGVDMVQAQRLADANNQYTPDEIGVQVILPGSTLRRSADRSLLSRTAKMLSNAWVLKSEGDGASQFSSFTATVGSAGTVASPGHCEAIASILRVGNTLSTITSPAEPAPRPWHLILNPLSATPLRERLMPLGSTPGGAAAAGAHGGAHAGVSVVGNPTEWQQMLIRKGPGGLKEIAGLVVQESAHITIDGSGDAINAGYSSEGLIHVDEVPAHLDPDKSDKSMRGAVELNLWGSEGWGVYRPGAYGVAATFDAPLPTS